MQEKKTLIYILNRYNAYTVVEGVTEEDWNNILKNQYAQVENTEDGLYIENPILLEIQEIYADINNVEDFIKYVNNLIEENDYLCWCKSVDKSSLIN